MVLATREARPCYERSGGCSDEDGDGTGNTAKLRPGEMRRDVLR